MAPKSIMKTYVFLLLLAIMNVFSISIENKSIGVELSSQSLSSETTEMNELAKRKYTFTLSEPLPYVNYKDQTGFIQFTSTGQESPIESSQRYYLVIEDNFKAVVPNTITLKHITVDNTKYLSFGPTEFSCSTLKDCKVETQLFFKANRRLVKLTTSKVYLINDSYYDLVLKGDDPKYTFEALKASSSAFNIPPYTEAPTTPTLTSTLSWKFDKNVGVEKQIKTAKSLVVLGADVPSSSVLLVDLEHMSPASNNAASGTIVSAKFAIKSTMEPEDMQNALHQAVQDNKHDLSDLSVNTTKSDVFKECLTEGVTCGGLCVPCPGSESCVNDLDCFSEDCGDDQKCVTFDKSQGNSARALTVTPLTISFYLAVLICSYLLV